METLITITPQNATALKHAANQLYSVGHAIKIESTGQKSGENLIFNVQFDDPAVLFYLGTITQINYQLSDERFFRNKMSNP